MAAKFEQRHHLVKARLVHGEEAASFADHHVGACFPGQKRAAIDGHVDVEGLLALEADDGINAGGEELEGDVVFVVLGLAGVAQFLEPIEPETL